MAGTSLPGVFSENLLEVDKIRHSAQHLGVPILLGVAQKEEHYYNSAF